MGMFALKASDFEQEMEVLPDNWQSFRLFDAMSTQWRAGMAGPTGLDYQAVPAVASMIGIEPDDLKHIFQDLRVMEAEALLVMSESK